MHRETHLNASTTQVSCVPAIGLECHVILCLQTHRLYTLSSAIPYDWYLQLSRRWVSADLHLQRRRIVEDASLPVVTRSTSVHRPTIAALLGCSGSGRGGSSKGDGTTGKLLQVLELLDPTNLGTHVLDKNFFHWLSILSIHTDGPMHA